MKKISKKSELVIIAGNGLSRLSFNLNQIKLKLDCELYACNLAHTNVTPGGLLADLVFAIDSNVRDFIKTKCNAVELGEEWRYEPYDLWKSDLRPYNNSGSIAIQWAIQHGKKEIHLFGFDCLIDNNKKSGNIFSGNTFYNHTPTDIEVLCRVNYLNWIIETNKEVKFILYYPQNEVHYLLPHDNIEYRYELHI